MQSCLGTRHGEIRYEPNLYEWPAYPGHSPLQHLPGLVGAGCLVSKPGAAAGAAPNRIPESELDALTGLTFRSKKKLDRFSVIALAAAKAALASGSHDPAALAACGVFVGNATAGWTFTEPELRKLHTPNVRLDAISPYLATAWFPAAPQGQISIELGLHGFSKTIATDRCAGSQAIGLAFDQIQLGRCRMALAGGVEAPLTPFVEAGLNARERAGLAEGGAFVLMHAGAAGRVRMLGHRLALKPAGDRFTASWLGRWLMSLRQLDDREDGRLLAVCTADPASRDEKAAVSAIQNVFCTAPALPLRDSGDALAASAAIGVIHAMGMLEASGDPRSAVALCVGKRYVHAIMLGTD